MPIEIKKGILNVKDSNGNYIGLDVVAQETTDAAITRIEEKRDEVLTEISDMIASGIIIDGQPLVPSGGSSLPASFGTSMTAFMTDIQALLNEFAYTVQNNHAATVSADADAVIAALNGEDTPVTTYSVTVTLSHCTSNNSAASIVRNASYVADLMADSGYSISSVTVTMGGTDITSTVYNSATHEINIGSVTGNIVITATATLNTYTITNTLTHCANNNNTSATTYGSSYNATLTADTGYSISNIMITMGGTNITSTAYSNGNVSIANVTDNIVIIAAAQEIPLGTYTITKNLMHATVSNNASTVEEGSSYAAAVTAESGYTLSTVTVTMGGTNITSTAYSNGSISIASVTDNIVITVTATANTYTVTNTLSYCATSNNASTATHGSSYSATLTADTGYTISSVTVTMGGTDITSTVYNSSTGAISTANVTGNIVITATAQSSAPVLSSISAVFNDGAIIRATDGLDSLKTYLTVTATYSDSNTETVNASDYTLSGDMTVGTKIITVAYGGKTTTFQVTVHGGLTLDRVTLPSGYTQIEAIISNQSQYADLNVLSSAVSRAQYGVQLVTESNNYHEHILSSSATFYPYFKVGTSGKTVEAKNVGNTTISSGDKSFDWAKDTDYAVDAAFPDVKVNGTTLYTLPAGTSTNINNLFLCGYNDNGTPNRRSSIRVYYLKLYDAQNQLSHNYVPCTNSSNVAGLYDTVAEEFIASSAQTAFAAGEVL